MKKFHVVRAIWAGKGPQPVKNLRCLVVLALSLPVLAVSMLFAASAHAQYPICDSLILYIPGQQGFCDNICADGLTITCPTLDGQVVQESCYCAEDLPECTDPPTELPCNTPLEVVGCSGPNQIIQDVEEIDGNSNCIGADPFVRELTEEAVTDVLETHLLPESDRPKVLEYARESVRGSFFTRLVSIILETERTADEENLVDYYERQVKNHRIAQAHASEAEYARYVAMGQCGYVPPAGFTFEFPSACYTPLGIFDPTPKHPSLDEFKAYGYWAVTQQLLDDPQTAAVVDGATRTLGLGIAVATVVTATIYVALLVPGVFATVVGAIAPYYALVFVGAPWWAVFSGTAPALIANSIAVGAGAVAGAIGIVLFGLIFTIFSIIDLVDYDTFVYEVTHLVEEAEANPPPDLRFALNFLGDDIVIPEFYQAYIRTTLPEFPPDALVPAASACDPLFALRDEEGNDLGMSDGIALASTDPGLDIDIGLRGGWFAPTLSGSDPAQPGEPPVETSLLSLRIQVLDWDGKPRDVWRRGSGFITVDPNEGMANVPLLSRAETEFRFTGADGTLLSASLTYDEDATCDDLCPEDPDKIRPGACGCGTPDLDTSGDGLPDCFDACPDDPAKTSPGCSGCGFVDSDGDGDGSPDCFDACPDDATKSAPGACGCGIADIDTDGDGTLDCRDSCPEDPVKTLAGACGCGVSDDDSDSDTTPDCLDFCALDPDKVEPGECGCGVSDADSDLDGTLDCQDACASDPGKVDPGACGCGFPDTDSDGDGTADCVDGCAEDPGKIEAGACGCGFSDTDSDGDGTADCIDGCVDDPGKIAAGVCGCGTPDDDLDNDGWLGCLDNCPDAANADQEDFDGDSLGDVCDEDADADGVTAADACPFTPLGALVDAQGCALDQLVPCDGPANTSNPWKNHGEYIKWLAKAVNDFIKAGLMTEEEADALLLEAGENNCGR